MHGLMEIIEAINDIIWADTVLYTVLATGVLFTVWSGFCQYRALTHGVAVTRGKYDDPGDPGAINHFQALSAALSATVGLGNIGGVALAIGLGGPGAIFWMWVVGAVGMALKTTEVTLAMLYRNTDDPDNPHGGAMWVVSKGLAKWNPGLAWLGKLLGGIFCVTLLVSAVTGGNMFQSWNVADITHQYFGVPQIATGIVLAILVGMVILGGIKRIGAVAGRLVPVMCALYLIAAVYVLIMKIDVVPSMLALIVKSAFSPLEAQGAFIGGTLGYAFLWGMKRALFSNEAGQGSAPIAHSAAKTSEPVREAVVSGLEPFIDTIVVCTLTALVILTSGIWKRGPEATLDVLPQVVAVEGEVNTWTLETTDVTGLIDDNWTDTVKIIVTADSNPQTGNSLHSITGIVRHDGDAAVIEWKRLKSNTEPSLALDKTDVASGSIFFDYKGATLTAKAFDNVTEGLGKWLVTLAAWLFAISTMISWSYYGEQGMVYLLGQRSVTPYKYVYCALIIVAAIPQLVSTEAELDALTSLGTGLMLLANIPIMLIFGHQAMKAYHQYIGKLKAGEFHPHAAPKITDVISGEDVQE
ncbi:MAG: sodium:alanine symporter family protein [Planctomycetes bacterium]|nr:sodium:alanine symporter family protein [Planctomycetota bacterium]